MKTNSTLRALDLSGNSIGVSGTQAIAQMLTTNNSLTFLSLNCNNSDVDGARSFKSALKANTSLQHLDVGYNRLRLKGVSALGEGLFSNPQSALLSLAIHNNFLSDDAFHKFLSRYEPGQSSLRSLFIQKNMLSELGITRACQMLHEGGEETKQPGLWVDALQKARQLTTDKLERTIWVSPIPHHINEARIRKFFQDKKCGVVVDVRLREGSKVQGKPAANRYAFVEFAHPVSVLRGLRLASKKKSQIDGNRVRIYRAGSRTVTQVAPKKSKK